MESNEIRVKQLCAVIYGDLWHRAMIVEAPAGDCVGVSQRDSGLTARLPLMSPFAFQIIMVDYGTCGRVPTTDIFKLHENFVDIPMKSVCCYLRNVKPKSEIWTMQNVADFIEYIDRRILFCKIYPFDGEVGGRWFLPKPFLLAYWHPEAV